MIQRKSDPFDPDMRIDPVATLVYTLQNLSIIMILMIKEAMRSMKPFNILLPVKS